MGSSGTDIPRELGDALRSGIGFSILEARNIACAVQREESERLLRRRLAAQPWPQPPTALRGIEDFMASGAAPEWFLRRSQMNDPSLKLVAEEMAASARVSQGLVNRRLENRRRRKLGGRKELDTADGRKKRPFGEAGTGSSSQERKPRKQAGRHLHSAKGQTGQTVAHGHGGSSDAEPLEIQGVPLPPEAVQPLEAALQLSALLFTRLHAEAEAEAEESPGAHGKGARTAQGDVAPSGGLGPSGLDDVDGGSDCGRGETRDGDEGDQGRRRTVTAAQDRGNSTRGHAKEHTQEEADALPAGGEDASLSLARGGTGRSKTTYSRAQVGTRSRGHHPADSHSQEQTGILTAQGPSLIPQGPSKNSVGWQPQYEKQGTWDEWGLALKGAWADPGWGPLPPAKNFLETESKSEKQKHGGPDSARGGLHGEGGGEECRAEEELGAPGCLETDGPKEHRLKRALQQLCDEAAVLGWRLVGQRLLEVAQERGLKTSGYSSALCEGSGTTNPDEHRSAALCLEPLRQVDRRDTTTAGLMDCIPGLRPETQERIRRRLQRGFQPERPWPSFFMTP